ncbi:MAG: hypothetical protein E7256_10950 [Lachnospiraceae bacterium]|nr:hypothetical protein [Lachnospiraceae bacterium]
MLILKTNIQNRKTQELLGTIEIRLSSVQYKAFPDLCMPIFEKKLGEILTNSMDAASAGKKSDELCGIVSKMLKGALGAVSGGEMERLITVLGDVQLDQTINGIMEKQNFELKVDGFQIISQQG